MRNYEILKIIPDAKQQTGSEKIPVQHELTRTSLPEYTMVEAVHTAAHHILLVHTVAAVVGNIGLAA
jgi:hypothetical protein